MTASHYGWTAYNVKGRWVSYWHQITEVINSGAKTVLEIGTGTGTVRDCLRGLGVAVTVVDIDESLGADRVGDDFRAEPAELRRAIRPADERADVTALRAQRVHDLRADEAVRPGDEDLHEKFCQ